MTLSIKLRLMSPDIKDTRHTKPPVTGLQHTSLGCEEGKVCQHHHITCQDTFLRFGTSHLVQWGFASSHTELLFHKDSVCAVPGSLHTHGNQSEKMQLYASN